jgi:hypothetical protein
MITPPSPKNRNTERRGQMVNTPDSFGRYRVEISAPIPAILTEVFCGFPQSL